jgi:hypothetical protein
MVKQIHMQNEKLLNEVKDLAHTVKLTQGRISQ